MYTQLYIFSGCYTSLWDPILDEESVEDPVYPPQNQSLEKIHEYSFEQGPIYERTHSPIILPHPKNMN